MIEPCKLAILLFETPMYNGGRLGNLRKVSLNLKPKSYLWAATQNQQAETLKTQRKNWKADKISQEQRIDKNFAYVNNVHFLLEVEATWSPAIYCLQAPNTPRLFGQ